VVRNDMKMVEVVTTDRKMADAPDAKEGRSERCVRTATTQPRQDSLLVSHVDDGRADPACPVSGQQGAAAQGGAPWTGARLQTGFAAAHACEEGVPLQGRKAEHGTLWVFTVPDMDARIVRC
jgi:hypothetical protein